MFKKQPVDPLETPESIQRRAYHKWNARQNRKALYQRIRAELLRDPALGISLLFAPILRRLADKAAGIIAQRDEAVFARAAEEIIKRNEMEAHKKQGQRYLNDAHCLDRNLHLIDLEYGPRPR